MNEDIQRKLRELVAELFKCDVSDVADSSGPGDIPHWDSLGHIVLLTEIQNRFDKKISVEEAMNARTIADLAAIINQHGG